MRAIIADDDPDARTLVIRALRQELPDLEVLEVSDPASLDAALAEPAPDLLVTDYELRWITGLDIFARVKAAFPGCCTVMFTGTGNEDLAVRAIQQGFDDYVVKSPKQFRRLANAALTALSRARERRDLQANREILLEELYHRLHNTLQMVVGLIAMTARSVTDPDARDKVQDLSRRIQSLTLLQEPFYRAEDLRRVDFRAFLVRLVDERRRSLPDGVGIDPRIGAVDLPVGMAVPLGLIANELLMDAVRRAGAGRISLNLERDADTVVLSVTTAASAEGEGEGAPGMGMHLVRRLADQMRARVSCAPTDGEMECRVTVSL